jgi:hypothetical protein
MTEYACSEEKFLKDVANHELIVLRDEGVNRHIRLKKSGFNSYWFDLITWNGNLCIDGDMGTYVFSRIEDMFEFFRTDRKYADMKGKKVIINPGYWAEKLKSISTYGKGPKEFDKEKFCECVKSDYDNWFESNRPDDDAEESEKNDFKELAEALWEEIVSDVTSMSDDGELRAVDAAVSFSSDSVPDFEFRDFWEHTLDSYTFHFIWCLYAIAWGIQKYDDAKDSQAEEAA